MLWQNVNKGSLTILKMLVEVPVKQNVCWKNTNQIAAAAQEANKLLPKGRRDAEATKIARHSSGCGNG